MDNIQFNDLNSYGANRHMDRRSYFIRNCDISSFNITEFKIDIKEENLSSYLEKKDFLKIYSWTDQSGTNKTLLNKENKILIEINENGKSVSFINDDENELVIELKQYFKKNKPKKEAGKVYFLTSSGGNFSLVETKSRKVKIDLTEEYEANYKLNKLPELINSEKTGLILLTSKSPGTGKSYLIRHLCESINKQFVFLPNQVLGDLSNPAFLGFALMNLKNSILIAEDAELCLIDRQKAQNDAASTLLNVTDGFLGDALNLKVICTINNEELVDRALLRKGRLLAKIDFEPLPIEKANNFLKKRGSSTIVTKATSLADLYNIEEENIISQERKIGFDICV